MHTLEHKRTKRAEDTGCTHWKYEQQIIAAEVHITRQIYSISKSLNCGSYRPKKVGNAWWILYMVVSDKNSPQEQRKQLDKAHELQAKPNTRMDNPEHWPSNQPQLNCDKMWHNSTSQWTPLTSFSVPNNWQNAWMFKMIDTHGWLQVLQNAFSVQIF